MKADIAEIVDDAAEGGIRNAAVVYNKAKVEYLAFAAEYPNLTEYGMSVLMIGVKTIATFGTGLLPAIATETSGHLSAAAINELFG
ncbi:hypothetical protein [Candidatus Bandiella euplotis]|nr:hypothetical protein [Candidatus Bandiella woodruffii]